MPRDHALALEIQGELEKLEERRKQLMEDLAEADPAVAELTALNQQTCTIGDLDFLLKVDDGRVAREYRRVANRMINDIELNPFRVVDGKPKPETRKLAIIMEVTPVVTSSETGEGRTAKSFFELDMLEYKFRTVLKLPDLQGASSMALIQKNPDGSIHDVRVNPESPDNPKQLTMFGN